MPHFDKHFTLAQANAALPHIREIFKRIHELIGETRGKKNITVKHPGAITKGRTNGKQHSTPLHAPHTREEVTQEINNLIGEIADGGIVIQDIMRGLIDFPAYVNGEEVFLCYELEDGDKIRFWHPLDTGYGGRQPVPEDME